MARSRPRDTHSSVSVQSTDDRGLAHGGPAHLHGRAPPAAGELRPAGGAAPAPGRGRRRRRHPRRRPRRPGQRRRRRPDRGSLPHPRVLPGAEPWRSGGADAGDAGRGVRVLPAAAGGEGQALLRRPGQEDAAVHQLQRAPGDGAQLARLSPPALPPARAVRPRLAGQPAVVQGDREQILQRSAGARVQALRSNLREPGPGGRVHQEGARRAGAAHGGELLPQVPGAGADVRAAGAHGPQRAHRPAHGPAGGRAAGPQGRQLDRREPTPQRAGDQYRRPAAGTEQRKIQERLAPRRRQLRQTKDVRGVVPVPVQQRAPRPRRKAHHRRLAGRVQGLHLCRVLQQVLEQEPRPGTLLGTIQNLA